MKWGLKDKKKYSLTRFINSFKYAFNGIKTSFKTEQNLIIHLIGLIINLILIFVLKLSTIEICIIILLITLVISLELVNTAIENVVNLAMPNIHPLAKISKDTASGAVLICCIGSIIIGIIIYVPKIVELFNS